MLNKPANLRSLRLALLLMILIAWFFRFTWQGLTADFYSDDLMNLHEAFLGLRGWKAALAVVWPLTQMNRPVGALYYDLVYKCFGLDPLAFRLVTYLFMVLNLVLAFFLARRLAFSTEVAFLTALFWCYHHRLVDIYFNNGTVYDVICFTFYAAALWYYIGIRQRGGDLRWYQAVLVVLVFSAALNAKEVAATFPVILIIFEIVYASPGGRRPWRSPGAVSVILATLLLAGIATIVKPGPDSDFYGNPAYRQDFSWLHYLKNNGSFLDDLTLHRHGFFSPALTGGVLVAVAILSILSRRKHLIFAALFAIVTPLPVSFIPARGFYSVYIAYFGWALLASGWIVLARDWLWPYPVRLKAVVPIATAVALMFAFIRWQKRDPIVFDTNFRKDAARERIRLTILDLQRVRPCPPRGGKVLFLNDRWPAGEYGAVFAARLVCNDPDLAVDLAWILADYHKPIEASKYNYVIDYRGGQIAVVSPPRR